MSTDTDSDTTAEEPDDDQPEAVGFEEGRKQTRKYASSTKVYEAHLPEGGIWRFEYRMVNTREIADEHREVKQTRQGPKENIDAEELELAIFCEGVVSAPDGFPLSPTKLKRQDAVVKEIVGEVADAIADYSTIEEETVREFH